MLFFFFSSRRRHTRWPRDWSSDVCSSDLVGVGGKDQFVSTLERSRDVIYALIGFGVDFPDHAEVCLGIDRAALGRQVANMPKGGEYLIPWAEVFTDRLRFGG